MNVFEFVFYLGIINLIFAFVWKWVFVLPAALILTIIKLDDLGMKLVKLFGSYLLAALTALLTLMALGENPSGWAVIFYPLIGGYIVFMGFVTNYYETRKEASANLDLNTLRLLEKNSGFDTFLMFGIPVFYVILLFIPGLAQNGLIHWFFRVIDWIYHLPIIGWLIGLFGVFFIVGTGFQALVILISMISKAFSGKNQAPN